MMEIWYCKNYTVPLCREYPEYVFVFGDNLVQKGKGGQAIIRDEPNTFGIPTKRLPNLLQHAFFSDLDNEMDHVLKALRSLYRASQGRVIVFPYDGIGTGRARMKENSPLIYHRMCEILGEHFGIRNGHGFDQALIG